MAFRVIPSFSSVAPFFAVFTVQFFVNFILSMRLSDLASSSDIALPTVFPLSIRAGTVILPITTGRYLGKLGLSSNLLMLIVSGPPTDAMNPSLKVASAVAWLRSRRERGGGGPVKNAFGEFEVGIEP